MNKILIEIKNIMIDCVKKYLPETSFEELEDNGAVYYMNGKNGTEFDWYVNEKTSDIMMFYDDEDMMGAVKTRLYNDGSYVIYVYGEKGKTVVQEIDSYLDVTEEEVLALAVTLRNEADDKRIWDENIEKINTDVKLDSDKMNEFISHEHLYDDMKERKEMLGKAAYVSKKIMDEGFKIGYMHREEALNEHDSGWSFLVGNEDDEYLEDYQNIQLMSINEVMNYDRAVWAHITSPVGTGLIRVSSDEFEVDDGSKEIYIEKME